MKILRTLRAAVTPHPLERMGITPAPDFDEAYEGLFGVAVTAAEGTPSGALAHERWPGLIASFRDELAGTDLKAASLSSFGSLGRDEHREPIIRFDLRLACVGNNRSSLARLRALKPRPGQPLIRTVWVNEDAALLWDPSLAVPLLGTPAAAYAPIPRASVTCGLTPLSNFGLRAIIPGRISLALLDASDLGRIALGVRRSTIDRLVVFVETTSVRPEHLAALGPLLTYASVEQVAIRPTAPGDPIFDAADFVLPLRRYPDAPRSHALGWGEARPLDQLESLSAETHQRLIQALADAGVERAWLAAVEARSLSHVDQSVLREPVNLVHTATIWREEIVPTVLVADPVLTARGDWATPAGVDRADAIRAALERRLGADRVGVALVSADDDLIENHAYARPLVG